MARSAEKNFQRRQRQWFFVAAFLFTTLNAQEFGVIAGGDDGSAGNPTFAAFVSSSGELTLFPDLPPDGVFSSVAMNAAGGGLVGGTNLTDDTPLAYRFSSTGELTPLSPIQDNGLIDLVVTSASGQGLITGYNSSGIPSDTFLAQVSPAGTVSDRSGDLPASNIGNHQIAINNSGVGIFAEADSSQELYAYLIPASPSEAMIPVTPLPSDPGFFRDAAISDAGKGVVVGNTGGGPFFPVALTISPSGETTDLSADLTTNGIAWGCAINGSNQGVITVNDEGGVEAVVYLLSPSGTLTPIFPDTTTLLQRVAINDSGDAIIAGDVGGITAFFISSSGTITDISFSEAPVQFNQIASVAISSSGESLLGGFATDGMVPNIPCAYLVSPTGDLTLLSPLDASGTIYGVSIPFSETPPPPPPPPSPSVSSIPTLGLSGNEAIFANYINQFAPEKVSYFLPAILDGTLAQALMSAVPTRNALTLFASNNNLFSLNLAFSTHACNARFFQNPTTQTDAKQAMLDLSSSGQLVAANAEEIDALSGPIESKRKNRSLYQVWGTVLGSVAFQKGESQTPGFQPTTGAILAGCDRQVNSYTRLGGGAAYAYTHVHEKQGAGHAHLNQEYLVLYSLWSNTRFYFDVALWGGLFQIDNLRKIHMTGFDFEAKSHPKGWQLAPHLELGCDFRPKTCLAIEPFAMFDWVNNWQRSYQESGGGPFNVAGAKHYSSFLRSEVGLRLFERVHFDAWSLVFQETLAYVNKKPFKVGTVNAFIIGSPGSFTVETFTTTQNVGLGEFQLIFRSKNPRHPYGSVAYAGEFAEKYQSHTVSLNLTCEF